MEELAVGIVLPSCPFVLADLTVVAARALTMSRVSQFIIVDPFGQIMAERSNIFVNIGVAAVLADMGGVAALGAGGSCRRHVIVAVKDLNVVAS